MSPRTRRIVIALILLVLLALALLFARCSRPAAKPTPPTSAQPAPSTTPAAAPTPAQPVPPEQISPATLQAPQSVIAGAVFPVAWTGPDNPGDYITIVPPTAADAVYANYTETHHGHSLDLNAPIVPGTYELRYVTARSKTVLGRAPITVSPATASLEAPNEAVLGTTISVKWMGPNNPNDYVTVVPQNTPDGRYGNYTETAKGSPLTLILPPEAGDAELRYMTGQGAVVLARRPLKILTPAVSLDAPAQVVAGSKFPVTWKGPNNPDDYVTIVRAETADGQHQNYTDTAKGSPLQLTALMDPGAAELRYMTGRGARVLGRRPIQIIAPTISLDAPAQAVAGAVVAIGWTGPNNAGDYITIVPARLADGQYLRYSDTSRGTPAKVEACMEIGPAEIRYMSGQGARVLARRSLEIVAARVTLKHPDAAAANSLIDVEWTGPNNPGDYFTIVAREAKDGATQQTVPVSRGSPIQLRVLAQAGAAEVRYMSGQGNHVLARSALTVTAAKP